MKQTKKVVLLSALALTALAAVVTLANPQIAHLAMILHVAAEKEQLFRLAARRGRENACARRASLHFNVRQPLFTR